MRIRIVFMMAVLAASMAVAAQAQPVQKDVYTCIDKHVVLDSSRCASVVLGGSVSVFGTREGTQPVIGSIDGQPLFVPQKNPTPVEFFLGYMPEKRFGIVFTFGNFESTGSIDSVGEGTSVVRMWPDQDVKPLVTSSNAITYSPVTLSASSRLMVQQFRFEGTFGIPTSGFQLWLKFGGVYGQFQSDHHENQQRDVLLANVLPNKQPDPTSDRKQFTFDVNGSAKTTGWGPAFGLQLETPSWANCLYVEGKLNQAFVFGTVTASGSATSHERISLVPAAQGFSAAGTTVTNIDTATTPAPTPFKAAVSLTEAQVSIGLRHGPFRLLAGIALTRFGNLPGSPTWQLNSGDSFQFGRSALMPSVTVMSIAPVFTAAVRF